MGFLHYWFLSFFCLIILTTILVGCHYFCTEHIGLRQQRLSMRNANEIVIKNCCNGYCKYPCKFARYPKSLQNLCLKTLEENISPSNVVELLVTSSILNARRLREIAKSFIWFPKFLMTAFEITCKSGPYGPFLLALRV